MEFLGGSIFDWCIVIGIVGVIFYLIAEILEKIYSTTEAEKKEILRLKNEFDRELNYIKQQEKCMANEVKSFFSNGNGSYQMIYNSFDSFIVNIESAILRMKTINSELSKKFEQTLHITISRLEFDTKSKEEQMINSLQEFEGRVYSLPPSKMLDLASYGKINELYWDSVSSMSKEDADSYIKKCDLLLMGTDFHKIYEIDVEEILKCIWYFALEKTFSVSDFNKAKELFYRIYKKPYVDTTLAEFYAKKKMGGEKVLSDPIRGLLKQSYSDENLSAIASGLMWMNAYQMEYKVLEHMLKSGKPMTDKMQERLHFLTNGGGNTPDSFTVESSKENIYFDISALTWKDEEFVGLFETLKFQQKALNYSLAIREESKELFILQGIHIPSTEAILKKFRAIFLEEYGPVTDVKEMNCTILSGSSKENIGGILVISKEYNQMGILVYIARIGKKLIIKFYTLLMPLGIDLDAQKQQALSLHKRLSPVGAMWENSLKDTMLMAVQQLLNLSEQPETNSSNPEEAFEEIIF